MQAEGSALKRRLRVGLHGLDLTANELKPGRMQAVGGTNQGGIARIAAKFRLGDAEIGLAGVDEPNDLAAKSHAYFELGAASTANNFVLVATHLRY